MRIIARHKNIAGCTLTESIEGNVRRFTATVRGWQKFKIYEGKDWDIDRIVKRVRAIRQLIDHNVEIIFYTNVTLR